MSKVILLSLMTIYTVIAHGKHKKADHNCMHDEMDVSKLVPHDYLETFEEKYSDRNLQKSTPQPMRITFDYAQLDNPANGEITEFQKQYLKNIMESAGAYLGKLIKVYPRTGPVIFTWGEICYDTKVSKEVQTVGIPNSDLHIFVTFSNVKNSNYLANAIWCALDPNPIVGRVKLNIGTMYIDDSPEVFQDNFSTCLHEILHILGFTGTGVNYWIDPDTGKPYGEETSKKILSSVERWGEKDVVKISSKNILRVARNHYGCPSIDGMYLENQGGGGSKGSHWERDLLANEFMTAQIVYGVYTISEFTAALLLDTGYYAEINSNMLMPMYWGKNKGCAFFEKTCNSGQFYPEFPDPQIEESCDFFSQGPGPTDSKHGFSQCTYVNPNSNQYCDDLSSFYQPDEVLRQNRGPGSRCFRSNASRKGENEQVFKTRCFKAKCAADSQSIDVNTWGDEFVNCKYPDQVIDLSQETKTSQGTMRCPSNFDMFCNFPKQCKNFCSKNGVCNNGYCVCINGWAGEDCSIKCPLNQAYDGSRCVSRCPSGLFQNFDNTCKSTCPYKYYKDLNTNTCQLCHANCSVCSGPALNQCTVCNIGYTQSGNSCIEAKCHSSCLTCSGAGQNQCTSCEAGKFLDSNKTCQKCQSPCSNCNNSSQCTTCIDGYFLSEVTGKCVSNNSCHYSCATCSSWRDASKCTSCKQGFFLKEGKCVQCDKQCKTCSGTSQSCTECNADYVYDDYYKTCTLVCHESCQQCTKPRDPKACIYCNGSTYFKNGECLPCDSSCNLCENSPTFCTRCHTLDQKLDEVKGTCSSLCRSDEIFRDGRCQRCQSPCASCAVYDHYCTSCISGYVHDGKNSCEQSSQTCHSTCNTCTRFNDEKSCNSCRNGMYLQNGQCINCQKGCSACNNAKTCTSCLNGFQLQNGVCIEKQVVKCHTSCKTCSASPNGDKTFCTSCSDGLYLSKESCLPCQSICKTCSDSSSTCTSCQSGFELKNGTCIQKSQGKCDPSCLSCIRDNDPLGCSSCASNQWLQTNADRSLGRCLPCDSNCKSCTTTYQCTACVGETGLDENSYCRPCASNEKLQDGKCVLKSRNSSQGGRFLQEDNSQVVSDNNTNTTSNANQQTQNSNCQMILFGLVNLVALFFVL